MEPRTSQVLQAHTEHEKHGAGLPGADVVDVVLQSEVFALHCVSVEQRLGGQQPGALLTAGHRKEGKRSKNQELHLEAKENRMASNCRLFTGPGAGGLAARTGCPEILRATPTPKTHPAPTTRPGAAAPAPLPPLPPPGRPPSPAERPTSAPEEGRVSTQRPEVKGEKAEVTRATAEVGWRKSGSQQEKRRRRRGENGSQLKGTGTLSGLTGSALQTATRGPEVL